MRTKLLGSVAAAAFVLSTANAAHAQCTHDDEALAQAALQSHLPSTKIKSVTCAPIEGLFEVVTGTNVFYTGRDGKKIIVGSIFDLESRKDLTAPAVAQVRGQAQEPARKVSWADIPGGAGIVWGAKGGRKLAIIADPNCPVCRHLHAALKAMPGIEVHEYVWPIFDKSQGIANDIVCSTHPADALLGAYQDKAPTGGRVSGCTGDVLKAVGSFAREHGWNGTPVIIRDDGAVMPGFRSAEDLKTWLQASETQKKG